MTSQRCAFTGLLAAFVLAFGGCSNVPTAPVAAPAAATAATSATTTATGSGAWELHEGASRIELRLDRAGPLARLGHRHVIVTRAVRGVARFNPAELEQAAFSAAFRVDSLVVDDPVERAAAGGAFATVLDAAAVAGTRDNMLSPAVLDAARFPEVQLRLQQLTRSVGADAYQAIVVFSVKAVEHALPIAVTIVPLSDAGEGSEAARATGYVASGTWTVNHAELGLTPFSAASGLLQVAAPIEIRFRLVASAP